jgi:hypothetical protein
MQKPELEFVREGPYGFILEKEPITVAAVLAKDQKKGSHSTNSNNLLLDCVLLDPCYIPEGFKDYELIQVRGRRLGRTIDILLDEPITVEETNKNYRILTFKGCGAFTEDSDEWIIDPFKWRSDNLNQLGRIWGAIHSKSAEIEASLDLGQLEKYGLKLTPYLFANKIPSEIMEVIYQGKEITSPLGQALRLCETNILYSDALPKRNLDETFAEVLLTSIKYGHGFGGDGLIGKEELFSYLNQNEFIKRSMGLIETCANADRELYKEGKKFAWTVFSEFISNAYIDATIKDLENLQITGYGDKDPTFIDSLFAELMPHFGGDILTLGGSFQVFPNTTVLRNYIEGAKKGPIVITDGNFDPNLYRNKN